MTTPRGTERPGPGAPPPGAARGGAGPAGATETEVVVETEVEAGEPAELVDDGIAVGLAPPPHAGERQPAEGLALDEVAGLEKERDEYLGALQRLQADFENYRKRVVRQREEEAGRAALDLVTKLLPVLDTLDLAEAHLGAPGTGEGAGPVTEEAKALSQARAQLVDVLAREGLERVDAAGVAFDPVVHDAVGTAPAGAGGPDAEGAEGDPGAGSGETVVDEVLRSGYRWHGRVLRPAMVRVRG